jgi:hypothetical protein
MVLLAACLPVYLVAKTLSSSALDRKFAALATMANTLSTLPLAFVAIVLLEPTVLVLRFRLLKALSCVVLSKLANCKASIACLPIVSTEGIALQATILLSPPRAVTRNPHRRSKPLHAAAHSGRLPLKTHCVQSALLITSIGRARVCTAQKPTVE